MVKGSVAFRALHFVVLIGRGQGFCVGGSLDNTGLTHIGAREYDPVIGRFISVGPVIDANDPHQLHGYAYDNYWANLLLLNDPFAGKYPLSPGDVVTMRGQLPPRPRALFKTPCDRKEEQCPCCVK